MRPRSLQRGLRLAICALATIAPRRLRPRILSLVPGFRVHPTSVIGFSFICPATTLTIGPYARVGHLTVVRNVDTVQLAAHSHIGNLNSISGTPRGSSDAYANTSPDRGSELVLGERAAITNRHYVDCADSVLIGEGSTVGGLRTVIVTHSLHVASGDVRCSPVRIGRGCLINTNCVLIGGSVLPDFCVLAPLSLLRGAHSEPHRLYAGNPAAPVRPLDPEAGLFRNAMTQPPAAG